MLHTRSMAASCKFAYVTAEAHCRLAQTETESATLILQEAGISVKLAPTIGIAVDHQEAESFPGEPSGVLLCWENCCSDVPLIWGHCCTDGACNVC